MPRGQSASGIRSATLVFPRLFSAASARAPALETAAARARAHARPPSGLAPRLFQSFGLPASGELPLAPVERLAETGRADDAWWVRLDPVYLLVEGARLILVDRIADLPLAEAHALAQEILAVFAADGWRLETVDGHWYLQPGTAPDLVLQPVAAARGHDVHGFLPGGADGRRWHGVLNELQMLLHASAVNAAREARGVLPVNSVWLSGGGRLPAVPASGWAGVWSGVPLAQGLGRLAGAAVAGLPATAAVWLREADAGEHLLVWPQTEGADWEAIESAWIVPLLAALREGALGRMVLLSDEGPAFALEAGDLRRWWRRRRPLRDYATAP